ncbi:MAG: hypothetical protein COB35_09135 [Gammaproteobacteria bacterium]|nr:MAG: hypothetical protein COB35_09135 [Gammaproteobacteria bacterium]
MKGLLIILCSLLLVACSSGVSVNLGDSALGAVVNTAMTINSAKAQHTKHRACDNKNKKAQQQCLQEIAKLKSILAKRTQ